MAGVWQEAGPFVGINLHLRWLVNFRIHITLELATLYPIICNDRSLLELGKMSLNADSGIQYEIMVWSSINWPPNEPLCSEGVINSVKFCGCLQKAGN